jgi:hypothetical protein
MCSRRPGATGIASSKSRRFKKTEHAIHTVTIPREGKETEGNGNVMKLLNRAGGWNSLPSLEHQAVAFLTGFKTNLDWLAQKLWGTATPAGQRFRGFPTSIGWGTVSLAHMQEGLDLELGVQTMETCKVPHVRSWDSLLAEIQQAF